MERSRPPWILPAIVVAQFMGTSLWLVGNSIIDQVAPMWPQIDGAVGWSTSAVQLGVIAGTLLYALLGWADRPPAQRVFFWSCLGGAAFNAATLWAPESFAWFFGTRLMTGVCLAGIYPMGMKLAASWYREGLGNAIGMLVGALVVGSAFPHILRTTSMPWEPVVLVASGLAGLGGVLVVLLVPEGPCVERGRFELLRAATIFSEPDFLRASLGFFGHMWEVYGLWAFAPLVVAESLAADAGSPTVASWSFAIIAIGAVGSVVGGLFSARHGSARVAIVQLGASGLLCLLSPWALSAPPGVVLAVLLVWGIVVVGDSPQFSALGARTAPPALVGTALTVMTAVGFAVSIGSLALLEALAGQIPTRWLFIWLLPGPLLGVLAMRSLWNRDPTRTPQ